ncbi:glutamate receptor 2.8-like protein [Cinnamomum micranthum f. kanehirae]|uniref:Glutamate receptor n=1 Tax=Cinnamomum micranthum f. kanehirae TaxID=337451 RepID=A0A443N9Z5_9MAGN|nr:glutamate receptor 2.8-like protein [Cinnamomum micranthum f. kanehirae]
MKNPTKVSFSFIILFSLSNLIGRFPAVGQNNNLNASKTLFEVGVVLDLGTPLGKMSKTCISMAMDDFYTTHNNYITRLNLTWMDSNQDMVDAASMAQNLLKNVQVKAIIGPQASVQAQFVAAMGNKAHVPILSFSATSPFLSIIQTPYFIRTALSDSSQVKAIAALIKAFGWREVVQICEDTPYGNGMIPFMTDALLDVEARVPYRSVISLLMNDDQIAKELYKLKTMQTRVFIVHLSPSLSSSLFFKANEVGMMNEGYVWIVTDGLVNLLDSMNSSVIQSMQGVLGVRPNVPRSKNLDSFRERWKRKFQNESPNFDRMELNIFGLWAYDTIWALAKTVEEVPPTNKNSTDLARLGISEMGSRLRGAILGTNFKGLSGQFNLTGGQLESSAFEIVNVIGKGDRVVGFWTPIQGLDKKLNSNKKTYSTSNDDLNPIIWPGESKSVPKGWVIPTSGKKLKIGVPKRHGFTEFVNAVLDPKTNKTEATGYCIDVFVAAVKQLPYAIEYEFSVYQDEHGEQKGSYTDLVMEVYKKNFDAVVGDTTIIFNRSLFVDFTLPYTESGVTMVVLSREKKSKAWIFLKPLSWDLWLMTGLAFTCTGFVVWVLEHRVNEEFRGPLQHQIGVVLWFSFSTLVFAHRERLVNNGSRFVVIIWVFVVWILASSYTASFTTLLTLQQLEPTINDIQDLIKNGHNVGYQKGAFVVDLLKHLNVDDSKLMDFESAEEFGEALSNGTVGAIFDEIPYLRSFLAKNGNCDKYKMVGPIYKTDGFGFVFPRGSPLVPDLSRAILNLTEGDDMKNIEKTWIGPPASTCSDQPTTAQSNSLTLGSFWGLFLITGAASLSALSIFLFSFLKTNRHVLTTRDPNLSFHQRLISIFRRFDERDFSHHIFIRRARPNGSLEMTTKHAENSPPVDASVPTISSNPNSRDSVFLSEAEDVEQHFPDFQL